MFKPLAVFTFSLVNFALVGAQFNTAPVLDTLFGQCCTDRGLFDDANSTKQWCNYTTIVGQSISGDGEAWPSEVLRQSPRFADYLQCMGMGKDWRRGCKKSLPGSDCYKLCKLDEPVKAIKWLKLLDTCGSEPVLNALYAQIGKPVSKQQPKFNRTPKSPGGLADVVAPAEVMTDEPTTESSTTTEQPTTTPYPSDPNKDEAFRQCCVQNGIDGSGPLKCSYSELAGSLHVTLDRLANPVNASDEDAEYYTECFGDGADASYCCAAGIATPACFALCDMSDDNLDPAKWAKGVQDKCTGDDIKTMLKCVQKTAYPVAPVSGASVPMGYAAIVTTIFAALAMAF